MPGTSRHWAVVPAAGAGARMQAAIPKQYLKIGGVTILDHTLGRICRHPAIAGVAVALAADDALWRESTLSCHEKVFTTVGGAERCHSVLNALQLLRQRAADEDWVLVHDAARPCVRHGDIDRLIAAAGGHPVGAILALPVHDTVKRADARGGIAETVDRKILWRALTPQMFRLGALHGALESAITAGVSVTDEAQAMERSGAAPMLVEGSADNIKVTSSDDLALAGFLMQRQENEPA